MLIFLIQRQLCSSLVAAANPYFRHPIVSRRAWNIPWSYLFAPFIVGPWCLTSSVVSIVWASHVPGNDTYGCWITPVLAGKICRV